MTRRHELIAQHVEIGARLLRRRVVAGDHERARSEAAALRGMLAELEAELPRHVPHPGDPEARIPCVSPGRWAPTPTDAVVDTYLAVVTDLDHERDAQRAYQRWLGCLP